MFIIVEEQKPLKLILFGSIQEFLVIPFNAHSFLEAAKANILVHQRIGSLLRKADPNFTGGRGDEGAWAPSIENEKALKIVTEA